MQVNWVLGSNSFKPEIDIFRWQNVLRTLSLRSRLCVSFCVLTVMVSVHFILLDKAGILYSNRFFIIWFADYFLPKSLCWMFSFVMFKNIFFIAAHYKLIKVLKVLSISLLGLKRQPLIDYIPFSQPWKIPNFISLCSTWHAGQGHPDGAPFKSCYKVFVNFVFLYSTFFQLVYASVLCTPITCSPLLTSFENLGRKFSILHFHV